VYALGAVLYELLTGRPPFLADSVESTLNQVICEEPIPLRRLQPKVPRDLETICLKCLEKSPARRYTQAIDLAEDLRRFRANEPITARPPSAWDRAAKFVRRHKALVAGVAVTLAAMLVGTIVSVLFALGESRQRHRADDNAQRREEARRQAEWEAYLARLAVAQARLDGHSLREAAKQLDKAPEQLRRWEWLYLHSRLDDSSAVVGEPEPRPEYPALLPASGHVVLASRDHGLSLWDADNHWLKDLGEGRVLAVASSRTESLVLVERRADGALVSFDDAGRPGPSFDVHGPFEPLFSAALTADGKQLALSWKTKTTSTSALFDPATGAVLSPLPPPKRTEIVGLAFSADGKHLVAETWPPENLELWDVPQRRHLAAWETNKAGLLYFNFSPDGGHILAVGSDESSYQWEVPSGQLLEVHRGAGSRSNIAALSPDGNWIAAGGKDGVLRIVSAKSGELVAEFQGHTDELRRVAFSPDGRSVWTASTDGTARYWDLATSGDPRVLRHECYVYALAYSPDGRWFASSSWQNSGGGPSDIHLWDAASGQPVALLRGHTDWVACLTITPDGKRIVAVDHSGSVHVWDTADGRRRKLPLTIRQQGPSYVQTSVTSPDGRLLALPDERQLRLWNLQSDKEEAAFATSLSGLRIAVFSPDGTRLAVAGVEPEAQILSVPKGEVLVTLRRHTRQVNAVNFSPDGSRIVTASEDRSVRLWDAATGELQTVLGGAKGVGHTQAVFAAVFHPDGTRIATGGRDRGVRIWDTATGEELVRLAGHTDYVFRLAFSPDGATLVSGSGDGTVRLWDAAPLRERIKARRELETLRPQADALVDRLLRQGCNADEVVERLGADADLSEPLRRAAWHALLRRR
jgi:WD40 repeat protein